MLLKIGKDEDKDEIEFRLTVGLGIKEIVELRTAFLAIERDPKNSWIFRVDDGIGINIFRKAFELFEASGDVFWKMVVKEILGDSISVQYPTSLLRRVYEYTLRRKDTDLREVLSGRKELPTDIRRELVRDKSRWGGVRRRCVFANRRDTDPFFRLVYVKLLGNEPETGIGYKTFIRSELAYYLDDKDCRVRTAALKALEKHPLLVRGIVRKIKRFTHDSNRTTRHAAIRLLASSSTPKSAGRSP
ncbi:MAG: hypothetical protein IJR99_12160 [Kiritimatiellae bacterium]|nr:hypothetical protein [Kiritimatiellia bacterium]